MTITYIWRAEQTEPGKTGVRYAATATQQAPAAIPAVEASAGLVYDESLYSDWQLLGTAQGRCYSDAYGESVVELQTEHLAGVPMDVAEIVRNGWYTQA